MEPSTFYFQDSKIESVINDENSLTDVQKQQIKSLLDELSNSPTNGVLNYRLVNLYLSFKLYNKALDQALKCRNKKINSVIPLIYLKNQDPESAIRFLEELVMEKESPSNQQPNYFKYSNLINQCYQKLVEKHYLELSRSKGYDKVNFKGIISNKLPSYCTLPFRNFPAATNINTLSVSKSRFIGTKGLESNELFFSPPSSLIQIKVPVKMVSCGKHFSMVLDQNGNIWNWGEHSKSSVTSQSFPYFSPHKFTSISAGNLHCAAISDKGELFTWGTSQFGQVGLGFLNHKDVKQPTQVLALKDHYISKVSCGSFHTSILTNTGDLFTCGRNHRGQLGYLIDFDKESYDKTIKQRLSKNPQLGGLITPAIVTSSFTSELKSATKNLNYSRYLQLLFNGVPTVSIHVALFLILKDEKLNNLLVQLCEEHPDSIPIPIDVNEFLARVYSTLNDKTLEESKSVIENIQVSSNVFNEKILNQFANMLYLQPTDEGAMSDMLSLLQVFHISEYQCSHLKNSQLKPLFNNPIFSDFKIKFKDTEFSTHKFILSERSNFFRELFISSPSDQSYTIDQPDLDIEAIKSLITYIYTDKFTMPDNITGDQVLSLIKLTKLFLINRLNQALQTMVSESVDVKNALSLLKFTRENGISQLQDFILQYISINISHFNEKELEEKQITGLLYQSSSYIMEGVQYTPKQVIHPIFVDTCIVDVVSGEKLTLVKTQDNRLVQIGRGSLHTYAMDDKDRDLFICEMEIPNKPEIKKISVGSSHCAALTNDNKLYGWGTGYHGQIGDRCTLYEQPVEITAPSHSNTVTCGSYSTIVWRDYSEYPFLPETNGDTTGQKKTGTLVDINIYPFKQLSKEFNFISLESLSISTDTDSDSSSSVENDQPSTEVFGEKVVYQVDEGLLSPILLARHKAGKALNIFGFSKEIVQKVFELNETGLSPSTIQPEISGEQFGDIMNFANMIGLFKLNAQLHYYLKGIITPQLACSLVSYIINRGGFNIPYLLKLDQYIKNNFLECSKCDEFKLLPPHIIKSFISKLQKE
eukprot:gene3679-4582_t